MKRLSESNEDKGIKEPLPRSILESSRAVEGGTRRASSSNGEDSPPERAGAARVINLISFGERAGI